MITSKAYKINGSWYAFNYAGEMYANTNVYYRHDDGSESYYLQKPMEACTALSGIRISIKTGITMMKMRRRQEEQQRLVKITYEFDNEGVLVANGAVLMHYGDTTVLCTATASDKREKELISSHSA